MELLHALKFEDPSEQRQIINRTAIILKYKAPFVKWEHGIHPWPESDPNFKAKRAKTRISLFCNREGESNTNWLQRNYKRIFEEELEEWEEDRNLWPQDRTFEQFRKWFQVSFTDFIMDEDSNEPIEYT